MDFATLFGGQPAAAPSPSDATPPQNAQAPEQGGFFQKMEKDPAFTQAMLMAGVRMMQGPRRGQGTAGMIGDAMAVGAATYGGQKASDQAFTLKQQEEQRRTAESQSTIARNDEAMATSKQKREQDAALFPETQKKVSEEIRRARLQGDVAQADLLIKTWKSDPKRLAEEWQLDQDKTRAQINRDNASAGASAAHARFYTAQTENPEKFRTSNFGTAQTVQNRADVEKRYRTMYPDESDAQINKRVLEFEKSAKSQDLEAAFFKFAADNGFDMSQPGEADRALAAFQAGQAAIGRAGAPTAPTSSVSEADIAETMRANKMSRAEVLKALKSKGYNVPEK